MSNEMGLPAREGGAATVPGGGFALPVPPDGYEWVITTSGDISNLEFDIRLELRATDRWTQDSEFGYATHNERYAVSAMVELRESTIEPDAEDSDINERIMGVLESDTEALLEALSRSLLMAYRLDSLVTRVAENGGDRRDVTPLGFCDPQNCPRESRSDCPW